MTPIRSLKGSGYPVPGQRSRAGCCKEPQEVSPPLIYYW